MGKLLLFIYLILSSKLYAQNIGIGNSLPTNRLHITAVADPIRLDGVQSASNTDSILAITSSGIVKRRTVSSLIGWSLTGNVGTTASNYIGTNDKSPLLIRTNNQPSGIIEPDSLKRNTAIGNRSLSALSTGTGNTAIGYQSLTKLTTGFSNTAIGDSALSNIVQGFNNTAIGKGALQTAVTSSGNIAVGTNALKNNVTSENIAIGLNAATNNTIGNNLLAIGAQALANNTTTSTQIAIGNNSLGQLSSSGLENIAIGYNAGTSLTNGSYNVVLGHYALSSSPNASNNTIIGHNAAIANNASNTTNNTIIGYQAAISQTGGNNNTFVGANTDMVGNTSVSNSTAIGQGTLITASNQVRIGNTSINSIGGQVGWTTFSDERIKTNIKQDVPGLNFITQLQPVTYNYNVAKILQLQGKKSPSKETENNTFESIRFTGLLAQQVNEAAKKIDFNFSGIDLPSNEQTLYGLRYAELVVPLIQSVKELKAIVDEQQQQIDALKKALQNK